VHTPDNLILDLTKSIEDLTQLIESKGKKEGSMYDGKTPLDFTKSPLLSTF